MENTIKRAWYVCKDCNFEWKGEYLNLYETCPFCKSKNVSRGELKLDGTDK